MTSVNQNFLIAKVAGLLGMNGIEMLCHIVNQNIILANSAGHGNILAMSSHMSC